jgi:aryl-alcohol dehydrogenase-like predicted oxidoreductase
LTGKYLEQKMPPGSRLSQQSMSWLAELSLVEEKTKKVQKLVQLCRDLKVSPAALAIAWCSRNPHVSSVITGASHEEQIHENMQALTVLPLLSDDVITQLNELFPMSAPS